MKLRPSTPAQLAADQRIRAAEACMTPEELRVVRAFMAPCSGDEDLRRTCLALGMTEAQATALAVSGVEKLERHYAEVDAAAHRRAGRLQ